MERNIRLAEDAAAKIWRLGAAALCPHKNSERFGGVVPDDVILAGDLEILRRCDALFLIDGWKRSAGATAERTEAVARGIPVFESIEKLDAWLRSEAAFLGV